MSLIPGLGRPPEKGMATHSSILAWRIPWREKPGRLQTTGLQRVGHTSVTNTYFFKVKNYTFRQQPHYLSLKIEMWMKTGNMK